MGEGGEMDDSGCGCGDEESANGAPSTALLKLTTPGAFADQHFRSIAAGSLYFTPPSLIKQSERSLLASHEFGTPHPLTRALLT